MAVDVGTVRVGIAATDPERRIAFPVETVARGKGTIDRIAALVAERSIAAVFVGMPRTLAGAEGASAADARVVAEALGQRLAVPVRLIDERFSTSIATAALHDAGRNSRSQRGVIDQAAAVVMLEWAIDGEKSGNLDSLTEPVVRGES